MNDNHDPLRRLSTRGTARGADGVFAAAEHGVARRRSLTRMAIAGTAVVVVALVVVVIRPTETTNDSEIGPAEEIVADLEPEPVPTPQPAPIQGPGDIWLPVPVDRDPLCGSAQVLAPLSPTVRDAAAAALDGWLNTTPRESAAPFVQSWDLIGDLVLAAAAAAPLPLDTYRGEIGQLVYWGSTVVCFEYSILNSELPVYSAVGAIIQLDGTWLVSRNTVCATIAVGGFDCGPTLSIDATTISAGCSALYGDKPWITLFQLARYSDCYRVAPFQRIRVFNKGNVPVFVDWPEGELNLGVDEFHDAAPAGEFLAYGENYIASDSISMPTLWLIREDESPLFGFVVVGDRFGPIRVGMTVDEANETAPEGFPQLRVDTGLLPGPELWGAVLRDDPFSPIFEVSGEGDGDSVIVEIIPANEY